MAYIQTEIETAVRGYGHHPLRTVFGNLRPVVCSFTEAPLHRLDRRSNGSGLALSEVPRDGGTFGTRGDVPDDHDIDSLSPCCRLAYRVGRFEAIEELAGKMAKQING